MALPITLIESTDTLESGFRAKSNGNFKSIVVDGQVDADGNLVLEAENGDIIVPLHEYFASKGYAANVASTPPASEITSGRARIATDLEVIAGANDSTIVTPLKLLQKLEDYFSKATHLADASEQIDIGNNDSLTQILGRFAVLNANNFLGEINGSLLTANRIATYPDRDFEFNKWADLSGVPTSFTPSAHFHTIGDVTGLSAALDARQPLNANLTSLANLSTTGIVRRSGVNTFVIGTNDPITLSGDVDGAGTTSIVATLANTGVAAGTYKSVTVDSKGRVLSGILKTTSNYLSDFGFQEDFATQSETFWNSKIDDFIEFGSDIQINGGLGVIGNLFLGGNFFDRDSSIGTTNQVLMPVSGGGVAWTSLSTTQISNFSTNVLGQVLTGLGAGSNTPITSSNTILTGFQNLQAQVSAKANTLSGTTNYLPKFISSSTIGNSQIFDNGTNIGIKTASPLSALHINAITYAVSQDGGITLSTAGNEIYGLINLITNSDGVPRFGIKPPSFGGPVIEALSITGFGFIGVNKIEPTEVLDVNGNIKGNNLYLNNHLLLNNSQVIYAKNSSGDYESVLFGRFSDNGTCLDGGTGGLHLRTANGTYEGIFINNVGNATFNYIPSCAVTPTSANHLVNKAFVDSLSFLKRGESVKTISFSTLTKSGLYAVNGYTLTDGDLVLDAGGTEEGGVWVASSGSWSRSTLNNTDLEIRGAYHYITNGTYANSRYINTNTSAITLDTTPITYDVDFGAETDPVWAAFQTANDLTNTRIANWNTAYSWGNHANLYVDKSTTQSNIGGAKTFTTSIESPIVRVGSGSKIITLFNYFGTSPRISSSASLDFFAPSNDGFSWTTTGDLTQMRLTAAGLLIGGFGPSNYRLQVLGTSAFSGLIHFPNPYTGVYSNGTNGQVIMRRSGSGLNYNEWATLLVEHISDISTYYQSKITATENYLTKKTATNFGDSQIFDNGTNIGIKTSSPLSALHINAISYAVSQEGGITLSTAGNEIHGAVNLITNSSGSPRFGIFAPAFGGGTETISILDNGNTGFGIIEPTEKIHVNGNIKTINLELTGKLKLNGSFGSDHYFVKSLGVDGGGNPLGTEWAILNCGEISDIADLYLSKAESETGFIKRITDEGERGFFLYADAENTVKEGFMFTNPDTGIMGIHAYRLNGATVEQYGFQLDKDGLPYWLFTNGTRKRILTENDSVGGGGGGTTYTLADPLYFIANQINVRTASSSQAGVLTSTKFSEFDAKLGQGSTVNTYLNFDPLRTLYFGYVTSSDYDARIYFNPNVPAFNIQVEDANMYIGVSGTGKNFEVSATNGDIKFAASRYFFQKGVSAQIEIDMSGFATGKVLKATSSTKAEWVTP